MSIDTSLKSSGGLSQHRNVLTRAERIAKLTTDGRFNTDEPKPIGLPKIANKKISTGKKAKKKGGEEAA